MTEQPLISVLMPTYNDSKYIPRAIESLLKQHYKNIELIVIDGSTDDTPQIVRKIAENDGRIRYLREQESGQLNALISGAQFVKGEYITVLHSDDELSDEKALERNVLALQQKDCDGVFCKLLVMNESGDVYKMFDSQDLNPASPVVLFLRAGSNIIPDFFFVKRGVFDHVFSNYLTWNMPYWITYNEASVSYLKLKKIDAWYKYRVYSENYLRSDVGKFETVNGCLRTVLEIGQRVNVPFLTLQRLFVRIFGNRIKPFFTAGSCSPKKMREMVMNVLNRYFQKIPRNIYFDGLVGFYSNFPSKRTIQLRFGEERIFLGKDARVFYNLMGQRLPGVYEYILEEATTGFDKVLVLKKDYEKARNVLKFLNLLAKIEVE